MSSYPVTLFLNKAFLEVVFSQVLIVWILFKWIVLLFLWDNGYFLLVFKILTIHNMVMNVEESRNPIIPKVELRMDLVRKMAWCRKYKHYIYDVIVKNS